MIQQSKNRSISNSIILILICSLFLSSCQNGIKEKIKNDDIIEFQKDDEIMNQAIAEAKRLLKILMTHLNSLRKDMKVLLLR